MGKEKRRASLSSFFMVNACFFSVFVNKIRLQTFIPDYKCFVYDYVC